MAVSGVGLLPVGMLVHAMRAPIVTKVVGEDAVAAPGSGAIDAGGFGAVPAVAAFEVIDSAFGSGPPFDLVAEGSPVFKFAAAALGLLLRGIATLRTPSACRPRSTDTSP
jgi:hypothetical protein